jgi:hypothetical protein
MTEISKEWCINMAKQEEGDIGAGKLAIDPTADNFHNLPLSESFERVAKADNAKLREAVKEIEASTYPRPLGKSWRMDLSSSKHDRCIHDEWMYDTCEGCLDDFIRKALQETER